jgi:hypothetical protein
LYIFSKVGNETPASAPFFTTETPDANPLISQDSPQAGCGEQSFPRWVDNFLPPHSLYLKTLANVKGYKLVISMMQ